MTSKKKWIRAIVLLFAFCLGMAGSMGAALAEAEEAEEALSFEWKGYTVTFPFRSTDMVAFGLPDFQGAILLVRFAPVEGMIKDGDFRQQLFCLSDPEGNLNITKFFLSPNKKKVGTIEMPADEQEYYDLLFVLGGWTEETVADAVLTVYEEEGGEAILEIPVKDIPVYTPGE